MGRSEVPVKSNSVIFRYEFDIDKIRELIGCLET